MAGGMQKMGDWDKAERIIDGMAERYKVALQKGLARVGERMRTEVRKGIRSQAPGGQAFEKLSEFTKRNKGSSLALIDHGDLLNSVTYEVDKERLSVFVGILRSARNRDGEPLVNLAGVHEDGCLIRVTPKMRAFFQAAFGVTLRKTTTHIRIPARPFLQPTFRAHAQKAVLDVQNEVAAALKGEG